MKLVALVVASSLWLDSASQAATNSPPSTDDGPLAPPEITNVADSVMIGDTNIITNSFPGQPQTYYIPARMVDGCVNLIWDPVADARVIGYTVYYGIDGVTFTNYADAGSNLEVTISPLWTGLNYFEVEAYDDDGDESPPSNIFVYQSPGIVGLLWSNTIAFTNVTRGTNVLLHSYRQFNQACFATYVPAWENTNMCIRWSTNVRDCLSTNWRKLTPLVPASIRTNGPWITVEDTNVAGAGLKLYRLTSH